MNTQPPDQPHDLPGDPRHEHELDARALEALLEAGFDIELVPATLREHARRIADALTPIETSTPSPNLPALKDATFARIMRTRPAFGGPARLSDADAEALDAFVMGGYDASRVPAALRDRARQLEGIGALLGVGKARRLNFSEARDRRRLSEAVMSKVAQHPRFVVASSGRSRFANLRWTDLVSIAATLLIAASVLWPTMDYMRDRARRGACEAGFGSVASAMGRYAQDFRDQFPQRQAQADGPWWNVGTPNSSNSANLFTLPKLNYASLADLACPGNPAAVTSLPAAAQDWPGLPELSYSYQIMFGQSRPAFRQTESTIVLADRSPVVLRARAGETIQPLENSPNHGGRGQTALFSDGSARWLTSPMRTSKDNIWLPDFDFVRLSGQITLNASPSQPTTDGRTPAPTLEIRITGIELPRTPSDTFLGP